jgi:integrase
MRAVGDRPEAHRLRALIVLLWRAGLRISEALALQKSDLDASRGAVLVRRGKVVVGARQLAQHERVKPIGFAARDPKPVTRRRDLVRVQRQHAQTCIEQPLDQQHVRSLDRHQTDIQPHQSTTQRPQTLLVVRERRRQHLHASLIGHEHVVLLRRPIDPGIPTRHPSPSN